MTPSSLVSFRATVALLVSLTVSAHAFAQAASATADQAAQALKQSWTNLTPTSAARLPMAAAPVNEALLTAPERASLAETATVSFQQPEEIWAVDGTLSVTLVGMMAHNRIGDDPVYLRSYNGKLVGPTLRAKPGETLLITLKNDFPKEPKTSGDADNRMHAFNTMNLHTHGLHVSPSGISDNVLLSVAPGETQPYKIEIPKDHPCGTFWYHTHKHGSTAAQVSSGMAGVLIITGGMDEVPEIKQARERILALQQVNYLNKDNRFPGKTPESYPELTEGVIELKYSNVIFAGGAWKNMGRFTTINGVRLPVFRVQPGAVERWRMVHAGFHESIRLKLARAPHASSSIPAEITLQEIAVDGLPLGKLVPQSFVELWPGNRSDVLVKFPDVPGEYLVVDEAAPADETTDGTPESRKYLARVVVEGTPVTMSLPRSEQLAAFRLPSIPLLLGRKVQSVTYGINVKDGVTTFNVNGRQFSTDNVRELTLGATEEWVIKSENNINGNLVPISHPHHIHVNPFEVYSILNAKNEEQLKDGPVWRDTVIVHGGWTVKARSSYTKFAGRFVQHCHILDHEDQGMMELVEIKDPNAKKGVSDAGSGGNPAQRVKAAVAAPAWELPDATGTVHKLAEFRGRPTVVFFFKGHGCLHCTQQVALFNRQLESFRELGADVIGVTTDNVSDLATALKLAPTPFLLVSDSGLRAFRDYGCFEENEPLHGTFVLDGAGVVRWKTIGESPFLAVDNLVSEVARLTAESSKASRTTAISAPSSALVTDAR